MSIDIKEINYKKYGKCLSIKNNIVEIIITLEFGPRVVFWGYINGNNLLCEKDYNMNLNQQFGHYLWFSPRTTQKKYNDIISPVLYTILPDSINFTFTSEYNNKIELSMDVILATDVADVMIIHRAKNIAKETLSISLSAYTCLDDNGILILPQNTDIINNNIPNRCISLWSYSKINDNRVIYGDKYITIFHDTNLNDEFKIGINNKKGWACYYKNDLVFVKRYVHNQGARYPDFGCSMEAYCNSSDIVVNSISPFYITENNETLKHVENWSIFELPFKPQIRDENNIEKFINSLK